MEASVTTQREFSISHDCLMVLSDKGIKDLISISHSSESSSMQHMETNVTIQRESSTNHNSISSITMSSNIFIMIVPGALFSLYHHMA
ncbi:hypothetical protein AVEN_67401-1 [Araneus ventricosus]|uniref:Uncharacterized protein n=1 Tax=Araneus ventricosus TaxID=182803 RepID=A0A4Y2J5H2_ARAVE|nr:hypothetical protein AVEN_67401-1 [Araneus ventricosus]